MYFSTRQSSDRLPPESKWGRWWRFPGKTLPNREPELARADFDLDCHRLEICGQGHILFDGLEAGTRMAVALGAGQQLAHRMTGRAARGQPLSAICTRPEARLSWRIAWIR